MDSKLVWIYLRHNYYQGRNFYYHVMLFDYHNQNALQNFHISMVWIGFVNISPSLIKTIQQISFPWKRINILVQNTQRIILQYILFDVNFFFALKQVYFVLLGKPMFIVSEKIEHQKYLVSAFYHSQLVRIFFTWPNLIVIMDSIIF